MKMFWQKKAYFVPLLILIGFFLYANQTTFLMAEDFSYSLVLQADYSYLRIKSFFDVIKCTIDYFYNCSGRLFANFINSFLLFLGLDIFKMINGFIVAAQIYILLRWIGWKKTVKEQLIICSLLSICLFYVPSSVFDEVFIWHTGAMFYSVPTLSILLYLTPFVYAAQGRAIQIKNRVIYCLVLIGIAFTAAFIPENYSIAAIVVAGILLIYCFFKDRKIDWLLLIPFLFHLVFTLICVFAPGSLSRLVGEGRAVSAGLSTITQYFKYQFVMVPFATLIFLTGTVLLLAQTLKKEKWCQLILVGITLLLVPIFIAALLNTQWLYSTNLLNWEFINYLRMPDDFYMWSGLNKMMILTVFYYFIVVAVLLISYLYIAIKKNDIMIIALLFSATLPILALIFAGGAEQRVVYWPFLSTIALTFYIIFNYFSIKDLKVRGLLIFAAIFGIYTLFYHLDYVSENVSIVKERQSILENIPNTTGDIILPRVRATVHGSVGEDTWDYWVMREYYGIQDRSVKTEPPTK